MGMEGLICRAHMWRVLYVVPICVCRSCLLSAHLQVFVGMEGLGGGGGFSRPFDVTFQRSRTATLMTVVMAVMGSLAFVLLVMLVCLVLY